MYTLDTTISELFKSPEVKAALFAIVPTLEFHPYLGMAMSMTLNQCATFEPGLLTPKVMAEIAEALKKF